MSSSGVVSAPTGQTGSEGSLLFPLLQFPHSPTHGYLPLQVCRNLPSSAGMRFLAAKVNEILEIACSIEDTIPVLLQV
jgi:hypothetical protein